MRRRETSAVRAMRLGRPSVAHLATGGASGRAAFGMAAAVSRAAGPVASLGASPGTAAAGGPSANPGAGAGPASGSSPGHLPLPSYLLHPSTGTRAVLGHLRLLAERLAPLGIVLGALVLGTAVALCVLRMANARRVASGGHVLEVLSPPSVEPESALMCWSHLVSLLRPAWRRHLGEQHHLAFELRADRAGLHIELFVPDAVPIGLVDAALRSAWPGALATRRPASPPLALREPDEAGEPTTRRRGLRRRPSPRGLPGSRPERQAARRLATGGELRLSRAECYPLAFEHALDPLRPLLGALASLGEHEEACIQLLARPVTGRRLRQLQAAAESRRGGLPVGRAARLLASLPAPLGSSGRGLPAERDPRRTRELSAILDKAASPCWAIALRYAVATSETGVSARARLAGSAHGIASAFAVFAGHNGFRRCRLRRPLEALARRRFGWRRFGRGDLVSARELAALAHLPIDTGVAGLPRAGARAVAPPPSISDGGLRGDAKRLGASDAGGRRPVALSVPDARYHLHVLGATGSGKSTLLSNLVLQDIGAGRGVVVIDPKGDLVTDVLARLPRSAGSRTVLIDPSDRLDPPVLNPLDGAPEEADLVVDNLVGIFRRIFEAFWGPRTDDVLRSACLTLVRHAGATGKAASLSDIVRLLSEESFRREATAGLSRRDGLVGFWEWYEQMGEGQRAQVIGPVMNKLRAFLLRDFARDLVSGAPSSFSMDEVLDGGLCLVRIPKGILGEETSRLIGSFVVAKIWQAATHRSSLPERERHDATCYVDECQNFLNLPRSFDEMLAEARGYRLSLVLAHQHLGQLPRDLKEAVSANARNKLYFSVSPEDAHVLSRHVAPELSEHDLSHLGAYQVAARLVADGEERPAFTLRTEAPAVLLGEEAAIRASARDAYGRAAVEARRGRGTPELAASRRPHRQVGDAIAPHLPTAGARTAAGTAPRAAAGIAARGAAAVVDGDEASGAATGHVPGVAPVLASGLASSGELRSDPPRGDLRRGDRGVGGSHGSPDSPADPSTHPHRRQRGAPGPQHFGERPGKQPEEEQ